MKRLFILSTLLLCGVLSQAGTKTGYVFFSSGGKFGVDKYVKFFQNTRSSNKTIVFDSLPGTYTNAAIVDQRHGMLFVNAEGLVAKYSGTNTGILKREDTFSVPGVSVMKVYKDWLIVGKGYGATKGNLAFYTYKPARTEFVPTITPSSSVNDMIVEGDTLFVSHGSGTPDSSFVSSYYLGGSSPIFVKRTFIGVYEYGVSKIFKALNNNGFVATSSQYGKRPYLITANYSGKIDTTHFPTLSAASRIDATGKLFASIDGNLGSIDLTSAFKITKTKKFDFSKLGWHKPDKVYIAISSDFVNPDKVRVIEEDGTVQDSFNVGASTEAMAIEDLTVTSIESEDISNIITMRVYPNPNQGVAFIESTKNSAGLLFDISGKLIKNIPISIGVNSINMEDLPNGKYILKGNNASIILIKN